MYIYIIRLQWDVLDIKNQLNNQACHLVLKVNTTQYTDIYMKCILQTMFTGMLKDETIKKHKGTKIIQDYRLPAAAVAKNI